MCDSLDYVKDRILSNLFHAIAGVVKEDSGVVDTAGLEAKIGQVEDKRTRLIDLYMSSDITKEQFIAARDKCEEEIAEIKSLLKTQNNRRGSVRNSKP